MTGKFNVAAQTADLGSSVRVVRRMRSASQQENLQEGDTMITAAKTSAALVGLVVAICASPSLAQPHHAAAPSAAASPIDHADATRASALHDCNRFAAGEYPWFEDVNRADAYRACMAEHGQPE